MCSLVIRAILTRPIAGDLGLLLLRVSVSYTHLTLPTNDQV